MVLWVYSMWRRDRGHIFKEDLQILRCDLDGGEMPRQAPKSVQVQTQIGCCSPHRYGTLPIGVPHRLPVPYAIPIAQKRTGLDDAQSVCACESMRRFLWRPRYIRAQNAVRCCIAHE